jgi:hypothetical protein
MAMEAGSRMKEHDGSTLVQGDWRPAIPVLRKVLSLDDEGSRESSEVSTVRVPPGGDR